MLKTGAGDIESVHLVKQRDPGDDRSTEIWLAASGVICRYASWSIEKDGTRVDSGRHADRSVMRFSPALLESCAAAFAAVLPLERPADTTLSAFFRDRPKLGQRDRAAVADTVYAALRRRRLLERIAPARIPRRQVLATWVALAGANVRELEGCAKPGELEWLDEVKREAHAPQSLESKCDLPDWVIERLQARFGAVDLLELATGCCSPRRSICASTSSRPRAEASWSGSPPTGIDAVWRRLTRPRACGSRAGPPSTAIPLFIDGSIEVQDEGSQLLGYLVAPRRGEMVVDFCAGAGGKTLALGALMRSTGRLYAFDVSDKRLAMLKPRQARSGLSNVHPQRIASENDARVKRLAGKIDRVLVDAPCSGLGTLRRNPDLKWRQKPGDVAELSAEAGVDPRGGGEAGEARRPPRLRDLQPARRGKSRGGRSVFVAACAVRAAIRVGHPEQQRIALDTGEYFELWPHRHGTDGFFSRRCSSGGRSGPGRARRDDAPACPCWQARGWSDSRRARTLRC